MGRTGEDIKTVVLATAGLAAQFTAIELTLKIIVGALTAVYLTIRIVQALLRGRRRRLAEEEEL